MGTQRGLGSFLLRPTLETAHSKGKPYPKQDLRAVRIQTESSLTQNHFKVQDTEWLTFRKRQNSGAIGSQRIQLSLGDGTHPGATQVDPHGMWAMLALLSNA